MKTNQPNRKSLLGALLLVVALWLWPAIAMAQGPVEEQVGLNLDAVAASSVSGTALLTRAGAGTNVALEVKGLSSGAEARAVMTAGTCAQPSASFATLPNLKADSNGQAKASGPILFHGTDPVALEAVADGQHVISIQTDKVVACGAIPHLAAVSGPSQLPATGGAGFQPFAIAIALLALGTLSSGLLLIRQSRS